MDTKQSAFIKSDQMAAALRRRFAEHHVYLLDLLASPGSGKTSTILATIEALRDEFNIAVVESEKASTADVERIKAQGIAAVRVDVDSACCLDAEALSKVDTVEAFDFDRQAFCENVRQVNPQAPIFPIVATKGEGVEEWATWLAEQIRAIQ